LRQVSSKFIGQVKSTCMICLSCPTYMLSVSSGVSGGEPGKQITEEGPVSSVRTYSKTLKWQWILMWMSEKCKKSTYWKSKEYYMAKC